MEDVRGTINAVLATPANCLDIQLVGSGISVLVRTDPNTQFSNSIGDFSNLQVGQLIEVNAQFLSDGTFLAKSVDLGIPEQSIRYQGVATRVQQDSLGNFAIDVTAQE